MELEVAVLPGVADFVLIDCRKRSRCARGLGLWLNVIAQRVTNSQY